MKIMTFLEYLNNNVNQSSFFNPTNIQEILEIVRSLKCSKSSGYDELNAFSLLKTNNSLHSFPVIIYL